MNSRPDTRNMINHVQRATMRAWATRMLPGSILNVHHSWASFATHIDDLQHNKSRQGMLLDCAGGEALDDLALEDERDDEHGHRDEDGDRRHIAPVLIELV